MRPKTILALACLIVFIFDFSPNLLPASTTVTNQPVATIITVPGNYSTIQEAINNASAGDTILVANGTYNEHLTINKTIALIGVGANSTILYGNNTGTAVQITAENVTVQGFTIQHFRTGIVINQTRNIHIAENYFTQIQTKGATYISRSLNIILTRNTITNNHSPGVNMFKANATQFIENTINHNDGVGIYFENCTNFTATGNQIESNLGDAICCTHGSNLNITENTFALNDYRGIWAVRSNGTAYHNNFISNRENARSIFSNLAWTNGYPSGGNYWSNYTGIDEKRGTKQNETESDGIGDTPHIIDTSNNDTYPLMKPYRGSHDIGIISITTSKTMIGQGYNTPITTRIVNYGMSIEAFNLTLYANSTVITTFANITLTSRNSATITYTWNTTDWIKGNYNVTATADRIPNETDTTDNTGTYRIKITIPGDINGDFTVNSIDATKVELYWIKLAPPTLPEVDINDDGIINIKDATIIGINWLKS